MIDELNGMWAILCVIFSCGTAYATIKVSLRSVTMQIDEIKRRVDETEHTLSNLKTDNAVSQYQYKTLENKLNEMAQDLKNIAENFNKLEKRGNLRWQENA